MQDAVLRRPGRLHRRSRSTPPTASPRRSWPPRRRRSSPRTWWPAPATPSSRRTRPAIDEILGFLNTFLLVFAAVSLVVGTFLIINTFSILVAQRSRELALLRALGASRRQVNRSVLARGVRRRRRRVDARPGRRLPAGARAPCALRDLRPRPGRRRVPGRAEHRRRVVRRRHRGHRRRGLPARPAGVAHRTRRRRCATTWRCRSRRCACGWRSAGCSSSSARSA